MKTFPNWFPFVSFLHLANSAPRICVAKALLATWNRNYVFLSRKNIDRKQLNLSLLNMSSFDLFNIHVNEYLRPEIKIVSSHHWTWHKIWLNDKYLFASEKKFIKYEPKRRWFINDKRNGEFNNFLANIWFLTDTRALEYICYFIVLNRFFSPSQIKSDYLLFKVSNLD